ncbi:MAG: hypothetical protein SFY80_13055 [Verrucomicrobiota bacterium]|nr:hypothetical protein [Verrucomicrobiota bacterium]
MPLHRQLPVLLFIVWISTTVVDAKPGVIRIFRGTNRPIEIITTQAYLPTVGPAPLRFAAAAVRDVTADSSVDTNKHPGSEDARTQAENAAQSNPAHTARAASGTPGMNDTTPTSSTSDWGDVPTTRSAKIPSLEEFLPLFNDPRSPSVNPTEDKAEPTQELRFIPARPIDAIPSSEANYKQLP